MRFSIILIFCFTLASFSQEKETIPLTQKDTTFYTKVDSLYREDQFYFGLTYNLLRQKPQGFSQK